jgi:hypothetical protein
MKKYALIGSLAFLLAAAAGLGQGPSRIQNGGKSGGANQSSWVISQNCGTQTNCTQVVGGEVVVYTATTNSTTTITCAACNFTSADVGKIEWATNLAATGFTSFQTYSVICPQGTISTVNSSTSITVSQACTSSVSGTANLHYGVDDTTALQAAFASATAKCALGKVVAIYLPDTAMILQKAAFVNASATCTAASGSGNPFGISIIGQGPTSRIDISPNFDLTTCTGPDTTGSACFGWGAKGSSSSPAQQGGMYLRDWKLTGPPVGGTTAFWAVYIPSDTILTNFSCSGWGVSDSSAFGFYIQSFNASLNSATSDGCGAVAVTELPGSSVYISGNGFYGDVTGNAYWFQGGLLDSAGNTYGGTSANSNNNFIAFNSGAAVTGTIRSTNDTFYNPQGNTSTVISISQGTWTAYFSHDIIGYGTPSGTSVTAIAANNASGTNVVHVDQSIVNGSTSLNVTSSGSQTYFDDCGNSYAGSKTVTGRILGPCAWNAKVYTVSTLPSASAVGAGTELEVSDSTSIAPGTCVGSSTHWVKAISDGTNWNCP